MKEYNLFDNRYKVVIGDRGGVKVFSNVAYGKELKVNGKQRDNLRYVNLTALKGGNSSAYSLESIKQYCIEGVQLNPLTECDILTILKKVSPPDLISNPESIELLEQGKDRYNKVCFIEYLEHYTRYYSKADFIRQSNGLLKYNYRVTTLCKESKVSINSTTETFTYPEKVVFNDVASISDDDLDSIFKLVNEERIKRKLESFNREFKEVDKPKLCDDLDYHLYCVKNH